ncbi:MAG: acetate--CoA ligase family protein [Proteobacteria bacterium]|nr:acetate--CoA ligase family protein [Pseudomonadota bacterium]
MSQQALTPLMRPRSIAVLGASPRPNTLGNNAVANLQRFGYAGAIFPVHPSAPEVVGLKAYANIASLPEAPDCAVVALSSDKVLATLEEAAGRGVRAAVVFASGFAEADAAGRALQEELQALCERTGLVVCGPNCLGLVNVTARISLYSSSVPEGLRAGGLAVVSHSGSGCIALSTLGRFGMSYMVSAGNSAVVDMAGYLEFLATDASTRVAALFMEQMRDPGRFAKAMAAMHAAGKPVVALKVGRSRKGAAASAAHTGSLAGSGEAYADFFRRTGVIGVDDLDEMAESIALMLAVKKLPRGDGLGMISVSGGETAMLCDVADRTGVRLPDPAEETKARLRTALPGFGTASNPLDATGNAVYDVSVYEACMDALASDPGIALVAVAQDCSPGLSKLGSGNYRRIAEKVAAVAARLDKPVAFFNPAAGGMHPFVIEPFENTDVAVMQGTRGSLLAIRRLFEYAEFTRAGRAGRETSPAAVRPDPAWRARLGTGAPFTEREGKQFLSAHGIPVTRESLATSEDEAVAAAATLGYPVVLKVESAGIAHKTEVGGVRVGLADAGAVAAAYRGILASVKAKAPNASVAGIVVQEMVSGGVEMIAGLSQCAPFGMGVVTGTGGVLVELVKDASLALAPLDRARALELIASTRANKLLEGFRGAQPADVEAFAGVLVALSSIAMAYGDLLEAIDLNPVSVLPAGRGVRVLDALIIPQKPSL